MFLLNRRYFPCVLCPFFPLHPNMFLLNPKEHRSISASRKVFTSQYVSIKSAMKAIRAIAGAYFTSQYVSIKSHSARGCIVCCIPLHPNMFLLNLLRPFNSCIFISTFTSQYVSIKSHSLLLSYIQ